MKQISKLSIIGYIVGIIMIIGSLVFIYMIFNQYYLNYPDLDKFLAYSLVGLLTLEGGIVIVAIAYLFDGFKKLKFESEAHGDALDDFGHKIENLERISKEELAELDKKEEEILNET